MSDHQLLEQILQAVLTIKLIASVMLGMAIGQFGLINTLVRPWFAARRAKRQLAEETAAVQARLEAFDRQNKRRARGSDRDVS